MKRRRIETFDAPATVGPYSQAIACEGPVHTIIHTAGQVALDPDTKKFAGGNAAEQTHRTMQNLGAILAAAGAGFGDVAQARIYLTDMGDYPSVNEAYASYFDDEPPARECVEVSALPLPDAVVEISFVAYK